MKHHRKFIFCTRFYGTFNPGNFTPFAPNLSARYLLISSKEASSSMTVTPITYQLRIWPIGQEAGRCPHPYCWRKNSITAYPCVHCISPLDQGYWSSLFITQEPFDPGFSSVPAPSYNYTYFDIIHKASVPPNECEVILKAPRRTFKIAKQKEDQVLLVPRECFLILTSTE
jgi:hypothetical protein